jgi:hypothetical protein
VMLAACLKGYQEMIRDSLAEFGRWRTNLYKRFVGQHGPRER